MQKKEASNEIDLVEIFTTMWNNKTKIILIIALTVAVALNFQINRADKIKITKKFTTKISAISIFDETQYQNLNSILGSYPKIEERISLSNPGSEDIVDTNINKYFLFDLFVTIFKEDRVRLVKKFNFIKRKDYKTELTYQNAVHEIASLINIIKIKENQLPTSRSIQGIIEFESQDINIENKWVDFVNTVENDVNKSVQEYLKGMMSNEIENAKFNKKNEIEDIEEEIKTTLKYYELEMNSRLSFLQEQAKIAREGNVDSEKVTPSSFGSNYSINYNEDGLLSLYYLKGYRVIEKEIELISKRSNPYLFAKNIPSLEARKLKIQSNQSINRVEAGIKKTPIFDDDRFLAGRLQMTSVVQTADNYISMSKMIIYAILIGFIIAIFYVHLSNVFHGAVKRNHK